MATTHGKGAYLAIEDSAATTLRILSANITSTSYGVGNDQHDSTTYGQLAHTWVNGLRNGTLSVTGFWDKTASIGAATVLDSLVGIDTTVGFEFGPEGSATGKVKYAGELTLVSVEYSAPVADLVGFTAQFNISGVPTKGVF